MASMPNAVRNLDCGFAPKCKKKGNNALVRAPLFKCIDALGQMVVWLICQAPPPLEGLLQGNADGRSKVGKGPGDAGIQALAWAGGKPRGLLGGSWWVET